jgi:DNA-binding NtrC family response regulator
MLPRISLVGTDIARPTAPIEIAARGGMSMARIELAGSEPFSRSGPQRTGVTPPGRDVFVGASGALRAIERDIDCAARFDARLLITGETGVGKDVVARLVHTRSKRRGPFVKVNCAAVPDPLLEWQLFGLAQGSFSGAQCDTRGRLEQAAGGTIFLDEISEMSLRAQALLLRFLEKGEIRRAGSDAAHVVQNVRVITATSRNLLEAVAAQTFREALYYRVNVIHIVVPALRDRPDDIGPLVTHFLERFSESQDAGRPRLSPQALAKLKDYPWPGNVRELRNIVERLILSGRTGVISVADLPAVVSGALPARRPMADVLYEQMVDAGQPFWAAVYRPFTSQKVTHEDVRALVARGLQQTRGSYKGLVRLFNLPGRDYRRFLKFLKKNECHPPVLEFRAPHARAAAPERLISG